MTMRLYLTAAGVYAGTQAEAKRDGKGWQLEEVPTDKYGLIDYLNALKFASVETGVPVADFRELHKGVSKTAQDQQDEALGDVLERPAKETLDYYDRALDRTVPQHRLAERAAFLGTSEEMAVLTDRIGQLDGWPLGQVALAAAARLKELAS
jgi:hypothetical protein